MKHEPACTALVICQGETVPKVSTKTIAESFQKDHAYVLKRVKNLLKECPADFNQVNFDLVEYEDAKGQWRPQFLLTRDAFCLLTMGFTGPEALAWKLRYIEAFNEMERALMSRRFLTGPDALRLIRQGLNMARRLTPERKKEIKRAVYYKRLGLDNVEVGHMIGRHRATVRKMIYEHEVLQGGAS